MSNRCKSRASGFTPVVWRELQRLGWSNCIDDRGTISLMQRVKRNICGRIIAREGDATWQRDLALSDARRNGRIASRPTLWPRGGPVVRSGRSTIAY